MQTLGFQTTVEANLDKTVWFQYIQISKYSKMV